MSLALNSIAPNRKDTSHWSLLY